MTAAGDLRQRIEVQSFERVDLGGGAWDEAWTTWATVWADVEPLSGFERIQAMQAQAAISHRVRVRYRADMPASGVRFLYRGRLLRQVGPRIDVEEERRLWEYQCEEVVQ